MVLLTRYPFADVLTSFDQYGITGATDVIVSFRKKCWLPTEKHDRQAESV
jgi:hypothetical protein